MFICRLPSPARQMTRRPVSSDRGTDRGGQVVAHARRARVREQALAALDASRLERHDRGGRVAACNDVVRREVLEQPLDEVIRVDRRPSAFVAPRGRPGTARQPSAPGEPFGVPLVAVARDVERSQQLARGTAGVRLDRHVDLHEGSPELRLINVDEHLEGAGRERLPVVADLTDGQSRTDDQQQVGVLDGEVAGSVPIVPCRPQKCGSSLAIRSCVHAVVTGMPSRDTARLERVQCTGQADAVAGKEHRSTGPWQSRSTSARTIAGSCVSATAQAPVAGSKPASASDSIMARLDVDRHVQPDGPGASGPRFVPRPFEAIPTVSAHRREPRTW